VRVKGGQGQVFKVRCSTGEATVVFTPEGYVQLTTPAGGTLTSARAVTDTNWHFITLTSYYAQKRTLLYLDKVSAGVLDERLGEVQEVVLGGSARDVSELLFWRSAMTPDEVTAINNRKMLKSSLEIYVPMDPEGNLENTAQSTNTVRMVVDENVVGLNRLSGAAPNCTSIYNISGQSLARTQRGVNIIGGKKVAVQ
jgi:hypothetical protein